MAPRKSLLKNVLQALVEEWGLQEVESALVHLELADAKSTNETSEVSSPSSKDRAPRKVKPTAAEQVASLEVANDKKAALGELARRFDQKQFLPATSDILEFLIILGEHPRIMKDRSDAFRHLLKFLATFSTERLDGLKDKARLKGPSQLGPLSDAISGAAASLPRLREPSS